MQFLVPLILTISFLLASSSGKNPRIAANDLLINRGVRSATATNTSIVRPRASSPLHAPKDAATAASSDGSRARAKQQIVWDYRICQKLTGLIQKKATAIRRIEKRIAELEPEDVDADPHVRPMSHLQADSLRILVQELDETEKMIWQSIRWLEDVLSGGDYSSVLSLTGNAWKRLDALRHATLKEEEEYVALVKAEENLAKANHTHVKGVIDDFLHEVSNVADDLEAKVDEHIFKDAVHTNESVHINGLDIETVIRVPYDRHRLIETRGGGDGGGPGEDGRGGEGGGGRGGGRKKARSVSVRLIDSDENQFVLARTKDSTMPQDDEHLIQDLILLWTVSTVSGWVCSSLHLPSVLGYVFSGMILGPAVFSRIQCIVQVETFGQFGIFLILFTGGLEFSTGAVTKAMKVSALSTLFTTVLLSVLALLLGLPWDVSVSECVFVASCLSLSSSSLVFRFLGSSGSAAESDIVSDCRSTLIGVLVIQKVFFGTLMAMLPNMAGPQKTTADHFYIGLYLATVFLAFAFLLLISSRFRDSRILDRLQKYRHHELSVVSLASLLFVFLMVTEHLHVSKELGCFLAGLVVSFHGQALAEEVSDLVRPLRDFFGCLFFATIGLHVYPQFLAQELLVVATLTVATVFSKYILFFISLNVLVHPSSSSVRWLVPPALAQVSECSFVLGSHARKLGLISREVYLLILGVTSMSFLTAPILWKISLMHAKRRLVLNASHTL